MKQEREEKILLGESMDNGEDKATVEEEQGTEEESMLSLPKFSLPELNGTLMLRRLSGKSTPKMLVYMSLIGKYFPSNFHSSKTSLSCVHKLST